MGSESQKRSILRKFFRVLVPILLIAAGGAAWAYLQNTAPRIQRKPPVRQAIMVEVMTVQPSESQPVIKSMGTVVPSREITLKTRVSGEIQEISPNFVPGGLIAKDELILRLDADDYRVNLQKAQSALAKARGNLALEEGNQTIAREEMRLLAEAAGEEIQVTDLAMRKPQLMQAQAEVASAEADLLKAQLDLKRVSIRAPFNCLVLTRNVDLGSQISPQDSLATLVSVDEYWVEAVVPMDRLGILNLSPTPEYPVSVRSQNGGIWRGQMLTTTGKINEDSRMMTLIIRVRDPLGMRSGRRSPQMILNDYVSVEIKGDKIASVVDLSRELLRDNQTVWIYKDGKLEIRSVEIVWKQADRVFIRNGLQAGEQLIVSNLSRVIDGMRVRIAETESKGKLKKDMAITNEG
jgi:RND family efflux transporter MFP subunit